MDRDHLAPLWEVLHALVPQQPSTPCKPAIWKYRQIRPYVMESGSVISAREAVRRVLILENPGMRGQSSITRTLYCGLQLILPDEIAPSHRHTQSALRLIVEGSGRVGFMKGDGVLKLNPAGEQTEVAYEGDAQVGGTMAAVGQRLIDGTAKMMIKKFFERLAEEAA